MRHFNNLNVSPAKYFDEAFSRAGWLPAAAAAAVTVGWRRQRRWRERCDRTEEGMVARGWRGWMGDRG